MLNDQISVERMRELHEKTRTSIGEITEAMQGVGAAADGAARAFEALAKTQPGKGTRVRAVRRNDPVFIAARYGRKGARKR